MSDCWPICCPPPRRVRHYKTLLVQVLAPRSLFTHSSAVVLHFYLAAIPDLLCLVASLPRRQAGL
jgi:hypothetical protein